MTFAPNIEITSLIDPLITGYKKIDEEWDNFFKIGLSDYLYSQTEKYYFTNTFLHRNEKVRFKNIYYPIKASYKKLKTNFDNVSEVFDEYKYITIVGSAGSGKTTLIKHIFLQSIQVNKKIPILIELRNLNEYNGDFEKLISEKILKSKVKPNDQIFKRTLNSGNFIILLDGYDEIFSFKKQEVNRQIELFIDSYPRNRFLITTRPGSGIENFSRFYDFKVCALDDKDVIGFISKIVDDGERKDRIKKIVLDPKNQNYFEFLRNPLLLSMFIMAFENHPEIPKRKSAFYRNVFDTLYSKHDGITKNSFPREKLTKLQRDDFEEILAIFSYLTLLEGQYSFTYEYLCDILVKIRKVTDYEYITENIIYDLRTTISILILDGLEYSFPHRSIQEYFTALFISKLPTNKKRRAYKNLTVSLQKSSTDDSYNFWSLCHELDETIFTSAFLLPQLRKILKQLENKSGRELLNSYLKLFDFEIFYINIHENSNKELAIYSFSNFSKAILDFCDIYNFHKLWRLPTLDKDSKFKKAFAIKIKSKSLTSNLKLYNDKEFSDLLVEFGILDIIIDERKAIQHKISTWENSVKIKKSNIDDLLKF